MGVKNRIELMVVAAREIHSKREERMPSEEATSVSTSCRLTSGSMVPDTGYSRPLRAQPVAISAGELLADEAVVRLS